MLMKKKINNLEGLTGAECKDYLKIVNDLAPVRAIYGRSKDGIQWCSTAGNFVVEILPHVMSVRGSLIQNQIDIDMVENK